MRLRENCDRCGVAFEPDAQFCVYCGARRKEDSVDFKEESGAQRTEKRLYCKFCGKRLQPGETCSCAKSKEAGTASMYAVFKNVSEAENTSQVPDRSRQKKVCKRCLLLVLIIGGVICLLFAGRLYLEGAKSEKFKPLGDMPILEFQGVRHFDETSIIEDTAGSTYQPQNVFLLEAGEGNCSYLEIQNDGQYQSVEGTAAVFSELPEGQVCGGWLEICVKDMAGSEYRQIYKSSQEFNQESGAETFEVDISGSSSIRFCVQRTERSRISPPLLLIDVLFERTGSIETDEYTSESTFISPIVGETGTFG